MTSAIAATLQTSAKMLKGAREAKERTVERRIWKAMMRKMKWEERAVAPVATEEMFWPRKMR